MFYNPCCRATLYERANILFIVAALTVLKHHFAPNMLERFFVEITLPRAQFVYVINFICICCWCSFCFLPPEIGFDGAACNRTELHIILLHGLKTYMSKKTLQFLAELCTEKMRYHLLYIPLWYTRLRDDLSRHISCCWLSPDQRWRSHMYSRLGWWALAFGPWVPERARGEYVIYICPPTAYMCPG